METLDQTRVRAFFRAALPSSSAAARPLVFILTHLLPDRPFLIKAIESHAEIATIFAKPKSIDQKTMGWLSQQHEVVPTTRKAMLEKEFLKRHILSKTAGRSFVLMDIGGYFTDVLDTLYKNSQGRLLGVVEDTENGIQRYERLASLPSPVVSVARSPLKKPEDFLVGQSIVFSVEALLRQQGDILHGRTACVIGYGKLGRSIANLLNARHVRTVVYDVDPVRSVEAMAHGFSVAPSLARAAHNADLVFCATGRLSLGKRDFQHIADGAYIATVTSSDDELALDEIRHDYETKQLTDYVTRYRNRMHHCYVLNRGQAVNFIHRAAVGPFIYLIQAELIASLARLQVEEIRPGVVENSEDIQGNIARAWLAHFGPKAMRT